MSRVYMPIYGGIGQQVRVYANIWWYAPVYANIYMAVYASIWLYIGT